MWKNCCELLEMQKREEQIQRNFTAKVQCSGLIKNWNGELKCQIVPSDIMQNFIAQGQKYLLKHLLKIYVTGHKVAFWLH